MAVCRRAVDVFFGLEPDWHTRRRFLPMLEKQARFTKAEALEFRTWLVDESRWSKRMLTIWEEAEEQGIAKGKAEGKAEALRRLLRRRKFRLSSAQEKRIAKCRDVALLNRWFDRAFDAQSPQDVFRSP